MTEQPWLSEVQNPFVISQHTALQGMTVSNLFKTGSREWDEEIIEDLFDERDRRAIYDIVVSKNCFADTRYWTFEHNGQYTVQSVYKTLQVTSGRWGANTSASTWRKLWKLTVPGKIKTFL